ncbi:MAG: GNAT family N-acetyltransferase, partial [Sciscionella sp.]|nr:GNAT family N-acetyltransferase [Sciscionella sp.]
MIAGDSIDGGTADDGGGIGDGVIIRDYTADDVGAAHRLRRLAFGGPRVVDPAWLVDDPRWRGLLAEEHGEQHRELIGFLRMWDMRQYFGGRAVPMGGVGSVAVEPHARGRGVASSLLRKALRSMREAGQCLSALYPATPPLYRSLGWENAGVRQRMDLSLQHLAFLGKRDRGLPTDVANAIELRRARKSDLPTCYACHTAVMSTVDGALARVAGEENDADFFDVDVFTIAEIDGVCHGYLRANRPDGETIEVLDFVATQRDAAIALLRSIGSWAGQLGTVSLPLTDVATLSAILELPDNH